jgi:predicted permease
MRSLLHRAQVEAELERELAFHHEQLVRENIESGMDEREARRAASRALGNAALLAEKCRDQRRVNWLDDLLKDLAYAARQLRKSPGFAATAVLSLAIGIGANTSVFTVMNALFLRSLPVRDPQQLRILGWTCPPNRAPNNGGSGYGAEVDGVHVRSSVSYPSLRDFQKASGSFASLAGFTELTTNAAARGQAFVAPAQPVTANFFETAGTAPTLGRTFREDEDRADGPRVAVISHRLWERLFGADPAALGSTMQMEGQSWTVIGVLPPRFFGLKPGAMVDVYVPLTRSQQMSPWYVLNDRDNWWVQMVGRLKPGASEAQWRAALDVVFGQQAAAWNGEAHPAVPWRPEGTSAVAPRTVLVPGHAGTSFVWRDMSQFLAALMGMVSLVLLIACVNVANLLVARGTARARELAIRQSLGASRRRIVRQLLTESLMLALAGGTLGLMLAQAGTSALAWMMNERSDSAVDLKPDGAVLSFTLGLSLATSILFGIVPALRATRVNAGGCLKTAGVIAGSLRQRLASSLVFVQVAMATVLVVGAGLFARSLVNLTRVELGFRPENVLLFQVDASRSGYKDPQAVEVLRRIEERLAATPGVSGVTMSRHALMAGSRGTRNIHAPGTHAESREGVNVHVHIVGNGFLTVMGTPILMGRDILASDDQTAPRVAVISQGLAKKLFDGNPIGREISFDPKFEKPMRVVGVAADARYSHLRREAPPTVYVPYAQETPVQSMTFEVRTAVHPPSLTPAVRRAVAEIDPLLPIGDVRTQEQQLERASARERTFAVLASFFSAVAISLAAIGLYGVLAYAVVRRTSEFGIRMALGATVAQVRWLVVRGALSVILAGVTVGIPAALAVTSFVKSLMYGVEPHDPWSIVLAVTAMLAAGLLAAWIPGRRASKADPAVALRYE